MKISSLIAILVMSVVPAVGAAAQGEVRSTYTVSNRKVVVRTEIPNSSVQYTKFKRALAGERLTKRLRRLPQMTELETMTVEVYPTHGSLIMVSVYRPQLESGETLVGIARALRLNNERLVTEIRTL